MSLYNRGIFVHIATWLISCCLLPFMAFGIGMEGLRNLRWMPLLFAIGLMPLCVGSAVWMLVCRVPRLRKGGLLYHVWVALGASLALLCYMDLQFTGDPKPPALQFLLPSIVAFALSATISALLMRQKNIPSGAEL